MAKKEGWKVAYDDSKEGELGVNIHFMMALPDSLHTPDTLHQLQAHMQSAKSSFEDNEGLIELGEDAQRFQKRFYACIGRNAQEGAGIVAGLIADHLSEPLVEALENDKLFSMTRDLLFEALKNTYDAVMIRNYLSALSPQALKETEPFVFSAMRQHNIDQISAVPFLQCDVAYLRTEQVGEQKSTVTLTDNGAGQAIVDAFKMQHSKNHRARMHRKLSEEAQDLVEAKAEQEDVKQKYDSFYDAEGLFAQIGMKVGGQGKGGSRQTHLLEKIGATQEVGGTVKKLGYENILSWRATEKSESPYSSSSLSSSSFSYSFASPQSSLSPFSLSSTRSGSPTSPVPEFGNPFVFPDLGSQLNIIMEGGDSDLELDFIESPNKEIVPDFKKSRQQNSKSRIEKPQPQKNILKNK